MRLDAGAILREERVRRGWSMPVLSERAGVAVGSVQGVEAGRIATLETYARLANALGLRSALTFEAGRGSARPKSDSEDFVHATMGEFEARTLRRPGRWVGIDEPYQHFQFAGRADVLISDGPDLLHIENRSRLPNIQEAAGNYNAKRQYLPAAVADRLGIGARGWRSVTHVMACLWSSEVLHVLRLRPETFSALCPDGPEGFEAWLRGTPPRPGVTSCLVLLDPVVPLGSRRRTWASLDAVPRVHPRYRGYADAADAIRGRTTRRP